MAKRSFRVPPVEIQTALPRSWWTSVHWAILVYVVLVVLVSAAIDAQWLFLVEWSWTFSANLVEFVQLLVRLDRASRAYCYAAEILGFLVFMTGHSAFWLAKHYAYAFARRNR